MNLKDYENNPKHLLRLAIDVKLAEAREKFSFDHYVEVRFDLRGRAAGTAHWRGHEVSAVLYINLDAHRLDPDHVLNNTVPHEVAHLVTWSLHGWEASAHGPEWQRICVALGGNGSRCHGIPLKRARKLVQHVYALPASGEVVVGPKQHSHLQQGRTYRVKATGEQIRSEHYTGTRIVKE